MATDISQVEAVSLTVRTVDFGLPSVTCSACQQGARRVWDTERVAIDIDLEHPVTLLVRVSVHYCGRCERYFCSQPVFLRPDAIYCNRVVMLAAQSVYNDGMAMVRVAQRLARDFWVQPSEASIRQWCRGYAAGLSLTSDYQEWIRGEFSGVLCVDEVYQGEIALLLAVDPAGAQGDRLVGYQLLRNKVDQAQIEQFLQRLRNVGIEPEEVITDGSALYPAALAKVWPTAVHQLCLFHETRAVTRAVLDVVKEIRDALPKPPTSKHRPGRPSKQVAGTPGGSAAAGAYNREAEVAKVQRLRREGCSIRGIVRQIGISRNTVRSWLRENQPALAAQNASPTGGDDTGIAHANASSAPVSEQTSASDLLPVSVQMRGTGIEVETPPAPWSSWDEVREFSQTLLADRFMLVSRSEHLTQEEQGRLDTILHHPAAEKLCVARRFVIEWYEMFRDEQGNRRSPEEALARYLAWEVRSEYQALAPLRRVQVKIDEARFKQLSYFLRHPHWEATNNGAERAGRAFRHLQAPHFRLRSTEAVEGIITATALGQMADREAQTALRAGRCTRGRKGHTIRAITPAQSAPGP
jgi:hypothetical protein